ncbi:DUF488 domain-containing protein [Rhodopseudomonas sp. BAL398]|nr:MULTISPECIES: DUF488 domain-containing protein [Rhodopseudomonas]MDF3810023.1 DUF488 domain-containing protein [Rhodopseudomonas sp. BAL398]WOK20849.1 DUF488 domain-containing protein [Rhodopseudomonas sp. BAL398]
MRTILTIGHSTHSYEEFLHLLRGAGVTAVADVRSLPFSRRQPQFNRPELKRKLKLDKIDYAFLGDELGGRPKARDLLREGMADYEKMALTRGFARGLDRISEGAKKYKIALMCAERDPLECHRCLLVGRALKTRGFAVRNILFDGHQKSQEEIESDLVEMLKQSGADLFPTDQIASAYRDRANRVAFSALEKPSSDKVEAAE